MRSEIEAYINRIKDNDATLTEIKITEGNLDGFDQLIAILSQNTKMARQIGTLKLLEITDSLDLNLVAFIRLRNLDLTSSNIRSLQISATLEAVQLTKKMCSVQVLELVSALKCEVIYDSEYSDVESYVSDEEVQDGSMQQVTGMLHAMALHRVESSNSEEEQMDLDMQDRDHAEVNKRPRRMGISKRSINQ